MATEGAYVYDETFAANADLSAGQYKFVKLVAGPKVDLCTAATDHAIGVLQNKPKAGEAAEVRILGMTKVASDGSGTAIAAGDAVGPDTTSRAVKNVTNKNTASGIAVDVSSAAGTIIRVLLSSPGVTLSA